MVTTNKPLMSLCAADIMSGNVTIIPREMSLEAAARMLSRAGVTGAPIVDAAGSCVGVLSATDFMHSVEKESHRRRDTHANRDVISQSWQIPCADAPKTHCCVEDYMTKDPVLVRPDTRIGELARIMMEAHIHRIIVVNPATKRPCGIVSSMDILAALARVESGLAPMEEYDGNAANVGPHR